MGIIVEWVEIDELGRIVMERCTKEEAIERAKKPFPLSTSWYKNDEEAFQDFILVHHATVITK